MKLQFIKAIAFSLLIAYTFAQFRFKQSYNLSVSPDHISFMNNSLILKTGKYVQILQGGNFSSIQSSFNLPFEETKIQMFPFLQQIIFINQNGIKSIQNRMPYSKLTISTTNTLKILETPYFPELLLNGEILIIPPIDNSTDYSVSSLRLQGDLQVTSTDISSQVVMVNNTYYFSNGVSYSDSTPLQQNLYFYETTNNNSYTNVFNFTVPADYDGFHWKTYQYLQAIQENNSYYFLMAKLYDSSDKTFVCELIVKNGNNYTSLGVNEPKPIKSIAFLSKDKLIYYKSTNCQILQSYIPSWTSNMLRKQGINTNLTLLTSPNQLILLGFDNSFIINKKYAYVYLLTLNSNSSFSIYLQLPQNKGGAGFVDCSFFNDDDYIAVYEGTNSVYNQLSFFSTKKLLYIQDIVYMVSNYSVCPNSNFFYIRTNWTIILYKLQNDSFTKVANGTLNNYTQVSNFTCGWDNSIFVSFNSQSNLYPFEKWELSNGTLKKTASLQIDWSGPFTIKAVFEDSIMFKGLNFGIYFFDYNLKRFYVPFNQNSLVELNQLKGNFLLFSDSNYRSSVTYSVIYEYINRTLVYRGSFPVAFDGNLIMRRLIFPKSRELYMQFFNKYTANIQTIRYKIDNPPQYRRGFIYQKWGSNTACDFVVSKITKSLDLIVVAINSLRLIKYSLDDLNQTDTSLLNSFDSVTNFKVSTSQTYICIWGRAIDTNNNFIEVRLNSNFNATVYRQQIIHLNENIIDCEVNDQQRVALLTFISGESVNLMLSENTTKDVKVEPTVSSVTAMAVCEDNGDYVYTGVSSQTGLPLSYMIVDSLQQSNSSRIDSGCEAKIIAFGRECSVVGYVCTDNTVNVYNRTANSSIFSKAFAQTITKLQILSDTKVLVSTPSSINIVDYANLTNKTDAKLSAAANSSIAIDFTRGLIAYSSDLKSITIADFDGQTVDAIANRDGFDVLALTFKSTGELFASFSVTAANSASSLMVWSNETCPQNQTISNSYCVCLDTYHVVDGSCVCLNNQIVADGICGCSQIFELKNDSCSCRGDLVFINNQCLCKSGFVEVASFKCEQCSPLCLECKDAGYFSCDQFKAGFYVLIIVASLIIIGIGVIIVIRLRKKAKRTKSSFRINNSHRDLLSEEAS